MAVAKALGDIGDGKGEQIHLKKLDVLLKEIKSLKKSSNQIA